MSRPHEEPTFYLDECVDADSLYDALVAKGLKVERHRKNFPRGTLDVDWLPEIGKRGWVVITKDGRIRKNELEIAAIMISGVATFVITAQNLKGSEVASVVVEAIPQMGRHVKNLARPFIANITKGGNVKLVKDSGRKAAKKKEVEQGAVPSGSRPRGEPTG